MKEYDRVVSAPELALLDEICGSKSPLDLPGAIRACLQEGHTAYAYLKATRIHGLNLMQLDTPPAEMCILQIQELVENNLVVLKYLKEGGFDVLHGRASIPVVDVEKRGVSIEEESVKRIETDVTFALALKGRSTGLVYVYLVYCLEYYKMRVGGRYLTFVAIPLPPFLYSYVKPVIERKCGFTDNGEVTNEIAPS